jgi:cell division protein FtsQ
VGFVIYPKVGDHRIVFGEPGEIAGKFRRLRIFYDQVLAREGWSRYRELDLRFRDQIVALPAGLVPLPTDTLAGTPLPDSTGLANPRPATGPPTPAPTPRPKAILPPTRP